MYVFVSCQVGVLYQCVDVQFICVGYFNFIEFEVVYIDKVGGCFNFQFYQVQQIGFVCDKFCVGYVLSVKCCFGWGIYLFIGKCFYDFIFFAVFLMAVRMLVYVLQ